MGELDDFLGGQEQPEAAVEPAAEPETQPEAVAEAPEPVAEEPKGPDRDEKGRFRSKGEEAAPPAVEEPRDIPVKALQEERRKRQELEQQLAELRQQLNPPAPPPSIWEDEQGYGQHITQQATAQAVEAATFNARLDMSEMMVRQSHPDFEDKKAAFIQLMAEVPGLQQKALSDPHPWNFAYNYVRNHERMQELSATNVSELEAKLEAKIRAQIEAETAKAPAPTPAIPETLADAQSARSASAEPFKVPTLDDILKR